MQSSLMRNFKRAATATGLVLLSTAAPFNASAHVLPGSVLESHRGFINAMHRINPDGSESMSCCEEKDAQGGLEEAKVTDPITGKVSYSVKLVNDEYGNPLENPVWIDIPDYAVLRYKDAVEFCKNLRETKPDSPDAATCTMPTTNALWTGSIPHVVIKPTEPHQSLPFSIYCYLPRPSNQ